MYWSVSPPVELGAIHVIATCVAPAMASTYCGADGTAAAEAEETEMVLREMAKKNKIIRPKKPDRRMTLSVTTVTS